MVRAHRVLTQQVRVRCHAKHAPVVPWVLLCGHVSVGTVCARVPESYGLIRIASGSSLSVAALSLRGMAYSCNRCVCGAT
jgi:hypothetical protein